MSSSGDVTPAAAPADKAALCALVRKAVAAWRYDQFASAASRWSRAAALALQLRGGATFVSAYLDLQFTTALGHMCEARDLPCADRAVLRAERWTTLDKVLSFVESRMDADTLVPGRCTKDEEFFYSLYEEIKHEVFGYDMMPADCFQFVGCVIGYVTMVLAARQALACVFSASPPDEGVLLRLKQYAFRATGSVEPCMRILASEGITLYDEKLFAVTSSSDAFSGRVSNGVAQNMGVPLDGDPALDEDNLIVTESDFQENGPRASAAKDGRKTCALSSCCKRGVELKICSACRNVWYCSNEHAAIDWNAHKPACRATAATKVGHGK